MANILQMTFSNAFYWMQTLVFWYKFRCSLFLGQIDNNLALLPDDIWQQWVTMRRDHFLYALSQWETMLQCNVVSHWLSACTKWSLHELTHWSLAVPYIHNWSGPTFIKPDQRNPWIKDQLWNDLLSTILHLQLPNFVSCGRDKPSHMTQNLVTVGVKL